MNVLVAGIPYDKAYVIFLGKSNASHNVQRFMNVNDMVHIIPKEPGASFESELVTGPVSNEGGHHGR
jgi:hypothetical protein